VDEWSDSRAGRFIPGEKTTGTHWIGGWIGGGEEKNSQQVPGIEPRSSSPQPRKLKTADLRPLP